MLFCWQKGKTFRQKEKNSCQETFFKPEIMSSKKRQKEEQIPDSKTKRRRRYSIQVKREIIELREKGLNHAEAIDYMS